MIKTDELHARNIDHVVFWRETSQVIYDYFVKEYKNAISLSYHYRIRRLKVWG